MSGNIYSIEIRRGCTLQFENFVLGGGLIRWFWQAKNALTFLWRQFSFGPNMFLWNNRHVPCPLAVAWISFIVVVMEIVHGIFKDPNGDGYPLDLRVWRPYNTHYLVLLLQRMPSYFPLGQFLKGHNLFLPCIFLSEAVTYQHNLLMKFCEWDFTSTEYLGSHILQCVKPPLYPVSLI